MTIIVYKQILRLDVSMNNSLRVRAFDDNELGVDVRQMIKDAHDE
jgi:hypothetical protein